MGVLLVLTVLLILTIIDLCTCTCIHAVLLCGTTCICGMWYVYVHNVTCSLPLPQGLRLSYRILPTHAVIENMESVLVCAVLNGELKRMAVVSFNTTPDTASATRKYTATNAQSHSETISFCTHKPS